MTPNREPTAKASGTRLSALSDVIDNVVPSDTGEDPHMSSETYPFPVAVSLLNPKDSRGQKDARAVKWLLEQSGGPGVVVTPQKRSTAKPPSAWSLVQESPI